MPRHEIWLTDDNGARIAYLNNHLGGYFYRTVNAPAPFYLKLPSSFNTQLLLNGARLMPDRMVQFWRAPTGGSLGLWRVYFVQFLEIGRDNEGKLTVEIRGYDSLELLVRRIVAAYAGSANASATATEADDLAKSICTDMLSDVIAPVPGEGTRAWGDLTIQADATAGPQLDKGFAWRRCIDVLQDLAEEARQAGTEVFFDIVASTVSSSDIAFEFRTYTGQPGNDLTSLGGVFDEARGNLQAPMQTYDNREAVNYVYAGGQNEGVNRDIQQVADATRYVLSQWNRREAFADARNQSTSASVEDAGRQVLTAGEPIVRFKARPKDTQAFRFGTDWDHGDKVIARFLGQQYETIIRKTGIKLDANQGEELDIQLEYQE